MGNIFSWKNLVQKTKIVSELHTHCKRSSSVNALHDMIQQFIMIFFLYDPDEVFLCHKFRLTALSWLQAAIKMALKPDIHSQVSLDLFNILDQPPTHYISSG